LGFMYRYALPRFDVIVSQTVAQKKMLLDNEGLNSTVIANGFPLDERHTDVDKDCVLWVGRDDPVKRPMLFIELARRLPDFKCIMIMQGNGELKDKVISEAEMTPGLELIDHVGFFEIQHYFDMAICLVNTSEKEGFSNAFIQACISSVPILSYRVNPDKVLTENKIGAVCNDSVEVAAEFIMSLCSNSLKDYGRNAYNYVKEKHDLQDRADEYESLIKDLVRCVE
jgi:glycosyltransferase involved in cell wall biosynthesis